MIENEESPVSRGMSDTELSSLIEREATNALGFNDLLADVRRKSLEYYFGDAEGDLAPPEVEGRSKVVSKDLLDAVEWIMPSMMRTFAGSDEVCRFEPDSPADEQGARDATRYVSHVIMEQNEGFVTLHDAIKNALIQRMGVVKAYCDESWDEREEYYQGLDALGAEALVADPQVEIIGVQQDPMTGLADIRVRRREQVKRIKVEGVPPEEFGINKDARTIQDARFVMHRVKRTVSELVSMGYDPALVETLRGDDGFDWGGEQDERRSRDESWQAGAEDDTGDAAERLVTLTEAYIRCDFDGDGVVEYRRVVKADKLILENEVTDDHPFALFSPILMPYRPIGLSMWDMLEDIQRIKTALTRQVLDSAYLANNPRTEVVENKVNLDDLLNPRPGGMVRVRELGSVREIQTPFVGQAGLAVIDYFNGVRDARSGVSEANQGLTGQEIAKSNIGSQGVEVLASNAMQRIELMARVFAETGIKRLWSLTLKLVTQYQDRPAQLKVNGRWLTIDPREWRNKYRTTITVGMAGATRAAQIQNLLQILGLQQQALAIGMADPSKLYNTVSRLVEQMGYRDAEQFFTEPQPGEMPPQQEQGSPEAQALVQAEQIKAQTAMQKAQMDNQTRLEVERMQIQSAERIAQLEQQVKVLIEEARMARQVAPVPNIPGVA